MKKLLLTLSFSLAALFVNPFGYRLLLYPFDLLFRQPGNMKYIDEWKSVDFNTAWGKLAMVMLFALLAAILFARRRWRLDEAILMCFAVWGALSHMRLFFFAGLILSPMLAVRLKLFPPYEREIDKPWLNAAVMAAVVTSLVYFFPAEAKLQQKVNDEYPAAALQFIQHQSVNGKIFNHYGWGGFMEWYSPSIKPFIDGRADIFIYNGTFADSIQAEFMEQPFEVLKKYNFDYVLFPPNKPLSYLLDHSTGWKVIYSDTVARLYQRVPTTCPAATMCANFCSK